MNFQQLRSLFKVSAFNVSLIILAAIGLVLLRLRSLINLLTLIAAGLYILASMCYQLEIAKQLIVQRHIFVKNCSQVNVPNKRHDHMLFLDYSKCYAGRKL